MLRVARGLLRCLAGGVQPGHGAGAESRHGGTVGTGQAQLPGRHRHHHRYVRRSGSLRSGRGPGDHGRQRHRGQAPGPAGDHRSLARAAGQAATGYRPEPAQSPTEMETWVQAGCGNSLAVSISKSNLELAVKEIDRNRAATYPTLDAVGFGQLATVRATARSASGQDFTQYIIVGCNSAIPSIRAERSARAARGDRQQEQGRAGLRKRARAPCAQNVRTSFLAVNTGLGEIQALSSRRSRRTACRWTPPSSARRWASAREVDVLNAQQLLYSAERDLARSYYATIISQLRLKSQRRASHACRPGQRQPSALRRRISRAQVVLAAEWSLLQRRPRWLRNPRPHCANGNKRRAARR